MCMVHYPETEENSWTTSFMLYTFLLIFLQCKLKEIQPFLVYTCMQLTRVNLKFMTCYTCSWYFTWGYKTLIMSAMHQFKVISGMILHDVINYMILYKYIIRSIPRHWYIILISWHDIYGTGQYLYRMRLVSCSQWLYINHIIMKMSSLNGHWQTEW